MNMIDQSHQSVPTRRTPLRRSGVIGIVAVFGAAVGLVAALSSNGGGPAYAASAGQKQLASAAAQLPESTMFAVIKGSSGAGFTSNGHVVSSQKLGGGLDGPKYRVTFDRSLIGCSFSATPTAVTPGDIVGAGTGIAVRFDPSFATRRAVDVITKDVDGAPIFNDSSFSLLVQCRS